MSDNQLYRCTACEYRSRGFIACCPQCGEIGSFEVDNTVKLTSAGKAEKSGTLTAPLVTLKEVKQEQAEKRISTRINELDRVLGGGLIKGEVVLFAGEPGAGKSSLALWAAENIERSCYVTGEETVYQVANRFNRFQFNSDIKAISTKSCSDIVSLILSQEYQFLIVDSLQTVEVEGCTGTPGGVQQSKQAIIELVSAAKASGCCLLVISQVNKSGEFAGSETVQHLVDCTLFLDCEKELRVLKASKNRFGDTSEVGLFRHEQTGLTEIEPVQVEELNGTSCHTVKFTGSRLLPVEVQALITPAQYATGKVYTSGLPKDKVQQLAAVLSSVGYKLDGDIYTAAGDGLSFTSNEPLTDLAVCVALLQRLKESKRTAWNGEPVVALGEVDLRGQVKPLPRTALPALQYVHRLGWKRIIGNFQRFTEQDLTPFKRCILNVRKLADLREG